MRLQFIPILMIAGLVIHTGPVLSQYSTPCGTQGPAKGQCATLTINYSKDANFSLATTYTNCKTGEKTTRQSYNGDCSMSNSTLGPYQYDDVLVGSSLEMGPMWTSTDNYNVKNAKAKPGNNRFLCSGKLGRSSAKCEPE